MESNNSEEQAEQEPLQREYTKEELQDLYDKAYQDLTTEVPAREVEMPDESGRQKANTPPQNGGSGQPQAPVPAPQGGGPSTLGDALGGAEDQTDMQYAMAKMFPERFNRGNVMVARIDPNLMLPMLHLLSNDDIMRSDPEQPINVNGIYANNLVALTIGVDGRGRVDIAELLGASKKMQDQDRLLSSARL